MILEPKCTLNKDYSKLFCQNLTLNKSLHKIFILLNLTELWRRYLFGGNGWFWPHKPWLIIKKIRNKKKNKTTPKKKPTKTKTNFPVFCWSQLFTMLCIHCMRPNFNFVFDSMITLFAKLHFAENPTEIGRLVPEIWAVEELQEQKKTKPIIIIIFSVWLYPKN